MFRVKCPHCGVIRSVEARKPWMAGDQPFSRLCKSCCQQGKVKSQEHRDSLSRSVKALQTEEVLKTKSDYQKAHPENWKGKIRGKGDSFTHSEETKQKIGDGVRKAAEERGGGS